MTKNKRLQLILDIRLDMFQRRILELKRKKRILAMLLFLLCGCAVPIKLTIVASDITKEDIAHQEKVEEEKELKRKYREIFEEHQSKLRRKLIEKEQERQKKKEAQKEYSLIFKSFAKSRLILKAFQKLDCSVFDISTYLNKYGKNDLDGFCKFLQTQYPFNEKAEWWLKREIFIPVERNYELLRRLYEK